MRKEVTGELYLSEIDLSADERKELTNRVIDLARAHYNEPGLVTSPPYRSDSCSLYDRLVRESGDDKSLDRRVFGADCDGADDRDGRRCGGGA
jgi:hypothetical protein